jgi:hypothetical protein
LVDYQTGLFDEEELRRTLFRGGMIVGGSEVWLLDVAGGTWIRYDGISAERIPVLPDDGRVAQRRFDAATLGRWQRSLRVLQAATPLTGVVGG